MAFTLVLGLSLLFSLPVAIMSNPSLILNNASERPNTLTANLLPRTDDENDPELLKRERALRFKVDLRLCTIAGLLCSLNLIDSGIISSASVTSMLDDLSLAQGNRYSVSILIFTVASVCFQLPATVAVRLIGPRIYFSVTTFCFGIITLVSLLSKYQRLVMVE